MYSLQYAVFPVTVKTAFQRQYPLSASPVNNLVGSTLPAKATESLENNLDIGPYSRFPDVFHVQFNPLVKCRVAPTANLPVTGEPRFYQKPLSLIIVAPLRFIGRKRSRSNKAHLALQHIEKLRQFVNTVPS